MTTNRPPIDPRIGLMRAAAEQLLPLFQASNTNEHAALEMAVSAIDAYYPDSPADYVNIARTIAFSMAALAVLGKAASDSMTMPEQMRAYGRANALNRSADQSERAMMQRRRFHLTNPPAELPASAASGPETSDARIVPPVSDATADDAIIQAAIGEAMQIFNAHRPSSATKPMPPDSTPAPTDAAQTTAASGPSPAVHPGQRSVTTPVPAFGHSDPNADTGQLEYIALKNELLPHAAIQWAAVHSPAQHPT